MPLKVNCKECNFALYEGSDLKSPRDIKKHFNGRCPKCNRELGEYDKDAVNLDSYDENSAERFQYLKMRDSKTKNIWGK